MINPEFERLFAGIELAYGGHTAESGELCAMELVAKLASEPHSDSPQCTCTVLTDFTVKLNDMLEDNQRQRLKPFLPLLIGSRDGLAAKRAEFFAWRTMRVFAPLALLHSEFPSTANSLRHWDGTLTEAAAWTWRVPKLSNHYVNDIVGSVRCVADALTNSNYFFIIRETVQNIHCLSNLIGSDRATSLALETLEGAIAIGQEDRPPVDMAAIKAVVAREFA